MSEMLQTRVLVIGGGPGGYVAAIRCGQLGLETVLVESAKLGGTCLNIGCIPSKAIIHAAGKFDEMKRTADGDGLGISLSASPVIDFAKTVAWKESVVKRLNTGVGGLLKKAKVKVVEGWAVFSDAKTCTVGGKDSRTTIKAEHVILATGSEPVELPFLKFGGDVISSTEALSLARVPKRLAIVGAGYIGLELGIAFRKLGSDVTIVEALDRILPLYDAQLTAPVAKWLSRHGVRVLLSTKARKWQAGALDVEDANGKPLSIPADKVLVTVGRKPRTEGWGIENMAVDLSGRFVKVDGQCRTSMKNVWAVGDLVGEPMLEHKAAAQGEMVAEIIAGRKRTFDPVSIPAVCFTEPEIASAGMLPGDAEQKDIETIIGLFPFQANGRALSMEAGEDGGFVRVVARKDNHQVLGVQAVGSHVAELSAAFSHALEMGALLEDIAGTIHVHPTLSEAYHEAALRALGHAIHI